MSTEPDYRKFYMAQGSRTVDFYSLFRSTVYVRFLDGRTAVSKTLRTPESLYAAVANGSLTTTAPAEETTEALCQN